MPTETETTETETVTVAGAVAVAVPLDPVTVAALPADWAAFVTTPGVLIVAALADAVADTVEDEDPETFYCSVEGCTERVDVEGDACSEDAYPCDDCGVTHHGDSDPACPGCLDRGEWRCADSCETCYHCNACGVTHPENDRGRCETCNDCIDTHACTWCRGCEEYHRPRFRVCGECENCECECDDEDEQSTGGRMLPYMRRHPIKFWGGKPTPFLPSKRHVSAEIEIARGGAAVDQVLDKWLVTVKPDGSVSDGCELNTAPAVGDQFLQQINEICRDMALGDVPASVDSRCGLHLHVDVGDYSYPAYLRLLWIWSHVEEAVYSTLPTSRRGNSYCARRASALRDVCGIPRELANPDVHAVVVAAVREAPDYVPSRYNFDTSKAYEKELVRHARATARQLPYVTAATVKNCQFKKMRNIDNGYGRSPGGGRYFGLNLQSAFSHGTVEFRCHGGTVDAEKITQWAVLCTAIVDYAKRAKVSDIQRLYRMVGWDALMEILPHDEARAYFRARRVKFGW